MDLSAKTSGGSFSSPSSSAAFSTPNRVQSATMSASASTADRDPMHSWWESVSKQRSRILSLSSLISSYASSETEEGYGDQISSLADSEQPALSFLSSQAAYSLVSSALCNPTSGSGSDSLCQWLYDTYLTSDPPLRLVVLSFLPLLAGIYLSRIHSPDSSSLPSLAGFEAVLLAIYAAEVKARAGKPILVHIPDLSQPSLYHTPRGGSDGDSSRDSSTAASVGVLSPPLEPQIAVKSTKRAGIVGVALQCYFKEISQMPAWSKLEFCRFAASWSGQECHCKEKIDAEEPQTLALTNGFGDSSSFNSTNGHSIEIEEEFGKLSVKENGEHTPSEMKSVRIPLPWELLQPSLRILGHCLLSPLNSQEVKDGASNAVRSLYARACHDLNPQAILATRSLVNLDKSSRATAEAAAAIDGSSNANTPSKGKKPEIFLASK